MRKRLIVALALMLPVSAFAEPLDLLSFMRQSASKAPKRAVPDSVVLREVSAQTSRSLVTFSGYEPGIIVVRTRERKLYFVQDGGSAISYAIGVGRRGFTWSGRSAVRAMREWPDWTPPAQMIARQPYLPRFVAGGPHNPLGARALYLGDSLYRIHGSNEPGTIGLAVSSGCIRMHNADVIDLYERVHIGTPVVVEQ